MSSIRFVLHSLHCVKRGIIYGAATVPVQKHKGVMLLLNTSVNESAIAIAGRIVGREKVTFMKKEE